MKSGGGGHSGALERRGDTGCLCKDVEEDTKDPGPHFICALQLVATVTPKQRPGGLILLAHRFPWGHHPHLPPCCLARGSTLALVGWGFRLLLWPWGAGRASESPPGHLGLEPCESPSTGGAERGCLMSAGEESCAHRKGGAQVGGFG